MELKGRIRAQGYSNSLLIAVNVIVFLAGTAFELLTGKDPLFAAGVMYPPAVLEAGQWYRLVTSMFLHVDAMHLANNMIMLAAVGLYVERNLGAIRFMLLYLISGVCGNLLSMLLDVKSQEFVFSAGASGAVFATVGALLAIALKNGGRIYGLSLYRIILMAALSLFGFAAGLILGLILSTREKPQIALNL